MNGQQAIVEIQQAKIIAEELYALLREDSVRRLGLFRQYAADAETTWTPDFQRRIELSESLCRKLDSVIENSGDAPLIRQKPFSALQGQKRPAG